MHCECQSTHHTSPVALSYILADGTRRKGDLSLLKKLRRKSRDLVTGLADPARDVRRNSSSPRMLCDVDRCTRSKALL